MQFHQLDLSEPILRAVRGAGYERATPIQAQAIPPVLDGRDVLGCAQTGTGKTAAFSLPILELLSEERIVGRRPVRALIVTPTRELAAQIGDSLHTYGRHLPLRSTVIYGGVSQVRQVEAMRRGVDILVATPGRLLDLINQGYIELDQVEILVLDEADRMLDMGFIHDIRKIIAEVPDERQTLFFSATMPPEIQKLSRSILHAPVRVSITPRAVAAETVEQSVYLVERPDKQALLTHLLDDGDITKALVFTRTKHGANRVVKKLSRVDVSAVAIHGNKSQNARTRALDSFKRGTARVLVASDIASRGLDIDDVSHVINFDLPNEPEVYVHRIGRTGRAGAQGVALSFCASEERGFLRSIERLTRVDVRVIDDHPFRADFDKMPSGDRPKRTGGQPRDQAPSRTARQRRGRTGQQRKRAPRGQGDAARSRQGDTARSRQGDTARSRQGDTARSRQGDTARSRQGDTPRGSRVDRRGDTPPQRRSRSRRRRRSR